ncbi:hypothetical protein SKAU_G00321980, partial [Synaphobranchus kaupii]
AKLNETKSTALPNSIICYCGQKERQIAEVSLFLSSRRRFRQCALPEVHTPKPQPTFSQRGNCNQSPRGRTAATGPRRVRRLSGVINTQSIEKEPQVKAALPEPASGPLHDLQPGDWVVMKDFRRKKWHQTRWRLLGSRQPLQKGSREG